MLLALVLAVPLPILVAYPSSVSHPWTGPAVVASEAEMHRGARIVAATATLGGYLGSHGANAFWGIEFTDDVTPTRTLVAVGDYLNTTPISWFRFGGDGSAYDPTTGTVYAPPTNGSGTYVATPEQLWNLTWFRSFCEARPTCYWLSSLPGEENNTQAAVHYAKWFHHVLGLVPTRWEFGNEPSQWTDFGMNITTWSTSANLHPTGPGYAAMVRAYVHAVSRWFPSDQYIGLEAACACNRLLAEDTSATDGAWMSSMAYHSYPTIPGSNTSLSQFYGTLQSRANITSSAARFRANVALGCATCGSIPIDLGEYQAGPFHAFSPFTQTYAGAPWIAASAIQALYQNLSMFTVFDWNALYNASSSNVTWEGKLYQRLLPNLTMGSDYAVDVAAPGVGGVEAILTENGTHESLLVVNTNTTQALNLSVARALFPVGALGSYWTWAPTQGVPSAHRSVRLASTYLVPAQGILLLDNY